ncbi:MAG: hypothetical protein ACRDTD_32300 [Pseudonocardiaceae bacterium]
MPLPVAVPATVMREHQRYLPVRDTHGALLPCSVANGLLTPTRSAFSGQGAHPGEPQS